MKLKEDTYVKYECSDLQNVKDAPSKKFGTGTQAPHFTVAETEARKYKYLNQGQKKYEATTPVDFLLGNISDASLTPGPRSQV